MYLLVGFIPYLGAADKVSTQFLYLGILNGLSIFYLLFKKKIANVLDYSFTKNYVVILLILFWIWSLFSTIYAINISEVIIESTRVLTYLQAYIIIYSLISLRGLKAKNLFLGISLILFVETFLVLNELIKIIDFNNVSQQLLKGRNLELKAFTGNIDRKSVV